MAHAPLIVDLINAKRASGFDGAFEALVRQPWYCPHCKASKTILDTMIPTLPDGELACRDCDKEGVTHLAGDGLGQFKKILDLLEPFNRSGTA